MTPNLTERRKDMDALLKAEIVPELKAQAFAGSYPNFRRRVGSRLDLLSFGFTPREGGGFQLSLGQCPAGPMTMPSGQIVPEARILIGYLTWRQMASLGPAGFNSDPPFDFRYGRYADCIGQVRVRLADAWNWFEDQAVRSLS